MVQGMTPLSHNNTRINNFPMPSSTMNHYEMMRANNTRDQLIEDEEFEAFRQTKFKLRCHHKLLILLEISSDVKLYKDMKSPDEA